VSRYKKDTQGKCFRLSAMNCGVKLSHLCTFVKCLALWRAIYVEQAAKYVQDAPICSNFVLYCVIISTGHTCPDTDSLCCLRPCRVGAAPNGQTHRHPFMVGFAPLHPPYNITPVKGEGMSLLRCPFASLRASARKDSTECYQENQCAVRFRSQCRPTCRPQPRSPQGGEVMCRQCTGRAHGIDSEALLC
jgi:hypothetical protein